MIKGVCGNETKQKQDDFEAILRHHLNVCKWIFNNRRENVYRYIDAFGGPGTYEGIIGSPVIFQRSANLIGIDYKATIIEVDDERYNSLLRVIADDKKIDVLHGDNTLLLKSLDDLNRYQYGLFYCDPPQDEQTLDTSFEMMHFIANKCLHLDLMLYIAPTTLKRIRCYKGGDRLTDRLGEINKNYWAIRELRNQQQWTFLIGTNYIKWAEWGARGFYNISSTQGKKILERANLTRNEIKKKREATQPPLTGLMQNTCSIPDLRLSGRKQSGGLVESVKGVMIALLQKFIIRNTHPGEHLKKMPVNYWLSAISVIVRYTERKIDNGN